ncbi:winged helix-turn-helix domain-containing protein [Beggiatoa leptomitoformis]|uniref:AAA domain-containing protein n=1 Tax=Beggiatoa leptomitoformis TaxID=288004 RepID=A0A2N9YDI5_9GAMM|nr:winged helix-turn-helix domain-containing protein [Beggiatoa leptomitoformis]AUI68547.1 AAA domain-containing protein [Beggiatoa leptomitoformis]QGX03837.1 AAA domain-containing protein [Beggiatoa leptomitoformis]
MTNKYKSYQYIPPLLNVLRELGGKAESAEVRNKIVQLLNISESTRQELNTRGLSKVESNISWMTVYLNAEGLIDKNIRGLWQLTEKGKQTYLTNTEARALCAKWNKIYKQRKIQQQDTESSVKLPSLETTFQHFQIDPLEKFRVKVRQHQAQRLRQLLANPETVSVQCFEQEVWMFESAATLNGNDVTGRIFFNPTPLTNAEIQQFEQALETGELILEGQHIWGASANNPIFAPHLKHEAQKYHCIQKALILLNNTTLTPLEKAIAIKEISGFGDIITTGLVMAFHPDEFAIYRYSAKRVLEELGYTIHSLSTFQQEISGLKQRLNAHDFIELDWFLYLHLQHLNLADEAMMMDDDMPTWQALLQPSINYKPPSFTEIQTFIQAKQLAISTRTLRRYHLALQLRGFVILSGLSGTGKTWLAESYSEAIQAKTLLVPVAPNWTSNEDLLGYLNPLANKYQDTPFSQFLREAGNAYTQYGEFAPPYHLILDEMNLARIEYYFARFLSALEIRARQGNAMIELAPNEKVLFPPNLYFIGTVNIDETTHGFADKVYDRAQLIELTIDREALSAQLHDLAYQSILMEIWDCLHPIAPFAFRVITEIKRYIQAAEQLDVCWEDALDEQIMQKILPKIRGGDNRITIVLTQFIQLAELHKLTLSRDKAQQMLENFKQYGIGSYF